MHCDFCALNDSFLTYLLTYLSEYFIISYTIDLRQLTGAEIFADKTVGFHHLDEQFSISRGTRRGIRQARALDTTQSNRKIYIHGA